MTKQKSKEFAVHTSSDKTSQDQSLVQLTVAQLENIAAGGLGDDCTEIDNCGLNHNETIVNTAQFNRCCPCQKIGSIPTITLQLRRNN